MTDNQLYNKYRPTTFKDIIGHKDNIKSLKRIVKDSRSRVFLLTGPAGTGKTTIARILANEFCGGKATNANLIEVPAAVFTGVEAMRQITDKALTRAIGESPNKIIILDEAHRLSGNAWDSLLKAIEEPPAHVFYMLCTTNPGKVPKTIVTRCTQIALKPLTEEDVMKILKRAVDGEGVKVEEEVLEAIAEHSGGSGRQALSFLESCMYCESASEARKIMQQGSTSTPEIVDFCRFLIQRKGRNWKDALRLLNGLKEFEAESIRIVVCNYMASVCLGSKSEKDAMHTLAIMECFATPYNTSDKFAPLLLSTAEALGMGD